MNLPPQLLAQGYSVALNALASSGRAVVKQVGNSYTVTPDTNQANELRAVIERKLSTKKNGQGAGSGSGSVKLNMAPVYMPIVLKRGIPIVLGILAVGFLVGRFTK